MDQKQQITVIFIAALPALGKTSLIEKLQEHFQACNGGFAFEIIISDSVRVASKLKFRETHDTSQMDEYQIETGAKPLYDDLMEKEIQSTLKSISDRSQTCKYGVLMVDKNHVPDDLRTMIISGAQVLDPDAMVMVLTPRSLNDPRLLISINSEPTPFYFDLLFTSFLRNFRRKDHPTMNHGVQHGYKSITNCLKRFVKMDPKMMESAYQGRVVYHSFFQMKTADTEVIKNKLLKIYPKILELLEAEEIGDDFGERCSEIVQADEELVRVFTDFDAGSNDEEIWSLFNYLRGRIEECYHHLVGGGEE